MLSITLKVNLWLLSGVLLKEIVLAMFFSRDVKVSQEIFMCLFFFRSLKCQKLYVNYSGINQESISTYDQLSGVWSKWPSRCSSAEMRKFLRKYLCVFSSPGPLRLYYLYNRSQKLKKFQFSVRPVVARYISCD